MFGNTYQMWDIGTERGVNQGFNVHGFSFKEAPDSGGEPINDIAIQWFGEQDARWEYNPADNRYYRWNTGLPHYDASTGEQLSAANVVILEAYHVDRPDLRDGKRHAHHGHSALWAAAGVGVSRWADVRGLLDSARAQPFRPVAVLRRRGHTPHAAAARQHLDRGRALLHHARPDLQPGL